MTEHLMERLVVTFMVASLFLLLGAFVTGPFLDKWKLSVCLGLSGLACFLALPILLLIGVWSN